MQMRPSLLSMIIALFLSTPVFAQSELDAQPAQAVADAYHIAGWDRIERIDFTFTVQRPGDDAPAARRAWSWSPKQGEVTLKRDDSDETITVPLVPNTTNLPVGGRLPEEVIRAHRQFINDSYWFLFPYQIVWSNPEVTYEDTAPLPIGEGEAPKITAQFPGEGGYTPGDAYDLYLDDNHRIQQWVFRRGGKPDGSAMTWEAHHQLGPIIVSLDHRGAPNADGQRFRLWFTDVRARVTGEDAPVTPQPMDDGE